MNLMEVALLNRCFLLKDLKIVFFAAVGIPLPMLYSRGEDNSRIMIMHLFCEVLKY